MSTIDNFQDTLDSRDVIARFEELTEEHVDLAQEVQDAQQSVEIATDADEAAEARHRLEDAELALNDWEASNQEELEVLRELNRQGEDYAPDWRHGETLIRDSYFEEHAEELAEELGAIDRNARWPLTCIDWEQAARELQQDYTAIDFDGVTYWIR